MHRFPHTVRVLAALFSSALCLVLGVPFAGLPLLVGGRQGLVL